MVVEELVFKCSNVYIFGVNVFGVEEIRDRE